MRKKQIKSNPDFASLLGKLSPAVPYPSLLLGKDGGWQTRMAWSPCDKYILKRGGKIQSDLYEFIDKHQKKKHLIIGFFNYDLGNYLYGIAPSSKDEFGLPLVTLFAYDNYLEKAGDKTYAHFKNPGFIAELTELEKNAAQRPLYDSGGMNFKLSRSKQSYLQAFEKIKDYIFEGTVYQINLTQKLEAVCKDNSRVLFNSLAGGNAAKMQAYLEADGFEIISMSPERFIKTQGKMIETYPIKGTRPRGKDKSQDKKNEINLLNDEKEKAELNMITDLLRNDLGKVCRPGSVKVVKNRQLEKLSVIMHTFSQVKGTLKPAISPLMALLSMFPGGSVTGCPKKKAMEIINDLEDYSRSAYCGSIFVIGDGGDMDSSILIRTIIKSQDRAILPVGSGVVNDSIGEKEYQENLDKIQSVFAGPT